MLLTSQTNNDNDIDDDNNNSSNDKNKDVVEENQTLLGRIVTTLVNNVQIFIESVHIRYIDQNENDSNYLIGGILLKE